MYQKVVVVVERVMATTGVNDSRDTPNSVARMEAHWREESLFQFYPFAHVLHAGGEGQRFWPYPVATSAPRSAWLLGLADQHTHIAI